MKKDSTASLAKQRINCTFYAVVKQELLWMHENRLVTKTGFVYLALKLENPFCDRPIDINVKEFAISWAIPESSVYEALAKLKDLKALKFVNKRVKIQWEQDFDAFSEESTYSQQEEFSRNTEFIPEIQNKVCNPRINSGIPENQTPEPLPEEDSNIPHTLQTSTESSDSVEEESLGAEAPQDSAIEKPVLRVKEKVAEKDVPERPLVPSTIDLDLQSHLEAAVQGKEPPEDIKQQLFNHPGYAPTYRVYAKRYGWGGDKFASTMPDSANEILNKLKERGKYKVPK